MVPVTSRWAACHVYERHTICSHGVANNYYLNEHRLGERGLEWSGRKVDVDQSVEVPSQNHHLLCGGGRK